MSFEGPCLGACDRQYIGDQLVKKQENMYLPSQFVSITNMMPNLGGRKIYRNRRHDPYKNMVVWVQKLPKYKICVS